jgi:hypothetical protein
LLVSELEVPVPVLEPPTELELMPPWFVLFSVPDSFPVLGALLMLVLELLPLFGSSLVVPAPPWFLLLQPTSAKTAQTMRINLFIAVVFFNLCLWFLIGSQSRRTIRHKSVSDNTVKPCLAKVKNLRLNVSG